MNPLLKDLDINKGDVVTIVGTGGKTTLLFHLAELLSKTLRVLVTTTTKIMVPEEGSYDLLFTSKEALESAMEDMSGKGTFQSGIVVAGSGVVPPGKLIGFSEKDLLPFLPFFDVILIEGDGSRGKKLKAWAAYEPVIPSFTTKTIGVLPITALGLPLTDENVHNLELFPELAGIGPSDSVDSDSGNPGFRASATPEIVTRMVLSGMGLFKDSFGEKILLINQADNAELEAKGKALASLIAEHDRTRCISQYLILSLEGSRHGNHSHYSSRRPWTKDEGRQTPSGG